MSNHLELEALQAYDSWYENNQDNLDEVEEYRARRVELVTALKEGAAVTTAAIFDIGDDRNEGNTSGSDAARIARIRIRAATSATSEPAVSFISRLSRASTEAIATIESPPHFDPQRLFFDHLEVEFDGLRRDRMRDIQDFKKEP